MEFLGKLYNAVFPFIIGSFIAYLLANPCDKLYTLLRKRCKDTVANILAVIIIELLFLATILLFIVSIIPQCYTSLLSILDQVPDYIIRIQRLLDSITTKSHFIANISLNDNITEFINTTIFSNTSELINTIYNNVTKIGTGLTTAVIGFIASIFTLYHRAFVVDVLYKVINRYFPQRKDSIKSAIFQLNLNFRQFLVGKTIDSVIIGVICFVIFILLDIPYAVTLATIIGVTNMIPIFGPIFGAIPGVFILLADNPMLCFKFVIIILIIQQIDGHIIGPKCIGYKMDVNTFWVLFSVVVFGKLFGIIGMFLGVPIFATLSDIVKAKFRTNETPIKVKTYIANTSQGLSNIFQKIANKLR